MRQLRAHIQSLTKKGRMVGLGLRTEARWASSHLTPGQYVQVALEEDGPWVATLAIASGPKPVSDPTALELLLSPRPPHPWARILTGTQEAFWISLAEGPGFDLSADGVHVFLAMGSGVAPCRAAIQALKDAGRAEDWVLFEQQRYASELFYRDDLAEFLAAHAGANGWHPSCSRLTPHDNTTGIREGRIGDRLSDWLAKNAGTVARVHVIGTKAFFDSGVAFAAAAGIAREKVGTNH